MRKTMSSLIKAVLFDIDGTILKSQGAGKRALEDAVMDLFGTTGAMDAVEFQGRTDPYIIHASLEPAGIAREEITARMEEIKDRYFSYLRRYIREVDVILLPGIRELAAALGRESRVVTGLLTGNFREGARIKLGVFDLFPLFTMGVFGDDTSVRNEMPSIAREKIRAAHGTIPDFGDLLIIGDTVHDVECGRRSGTRTLAVGTGWTPPEVLIAQGPDLYMDSLGDTERALAGIRGLLGIPALPH
jgi:phosphoglycolate phosphatase